jgi:hypothetical protein
MLADHVDCPLGGRCLNARCHDRFCLRQAKNFEHYRQLTEQFLPLATAQVLAEATKPVSALERLALHVEARRIAKRMAAAALARKPE